MAHDIPDDSKFEKLLGFMERLPAIELPAGRKSIGRGSIRHPSNAGA